jgi:hypothetical protein
MLRLFVISLITISGFFPWSAVGDTPELRLITPDSKIVAGQQFSLLFEASWNPSDIAIQMLPPKFDSIKWGKVQYGYSRIESDDSKMVYQQEIIVTPKEIGLFEFPEAQVPYIESNEVSKPFDPHKSKEDEAEVEPEPEIEKKILTVEAFQVDVVEPVNSLLPLVLIGSVILLSLLFVPVWIKRRRQSSMGIQDKMLNSPQAALHAARQYLLDHEYYPFYQALLKAVALSGTKSESKELRTRLEKMIRKVGYQEYTPLDDELDTYFREVERLLNSGPSVQGTK